MGVRRVDEILFVGVRDIVADGLRQLPGATRRLVCGRTGADVSRAGRIGFTDAIDSRWAWQRGRLSRFALTGKRGRMARGEDRFIFDATGIRNDRLCRAVNS